LIVDQQHETSCRTSRNKLPLFRRSSDNARGVRLKKMNYES
jgi:hypothetical protein